MKPFIELLEAPDFGSAVEELGRGFRERHGLPARPHQLGLVVPEVETAAFDLEKRGIGPFFIAAGKPRLWRERGTGRRFSGKLGLAYHRGFELELLEPGEGSDFYRQHLDPEGRIVVQHLGFLVEEVDREAEQLALSSGCPIYVRGRLKTGPLTTEFAYMDTAAEAGLVMEFISWKLLGRNFPPRPGLIHFLGRLEKWTGKRSVQV